MKKYTYNTFLKGINLDLHPLTVPNDTLTDALNATILTMNGNEGILQNDMGNARVESAFLPSGYVPIGIKEHGGIIYVASYNPLTNKSLIGSFPSPERNVDQEESSNGRQTLILLLNQTYTKVYTFNDFNIDEYTQGLWGFEDKVQIFDTPLHSGDRFGLYFKNIEGSYNNRTELLSNYNTWEEESSPIRNKLVTLYIQVLDSNNNLRDITHLLKRFNTATGEVIPFIDTDSEDKKFNTGYFILNIVDSSSDVTDTRNKSALNIYNNKLYGKVFLVGKVNIIDYINVSVRASVNAETATNPSTYNLEFTITYNYNTPLEYLLNPILVIKEGETIWPSDELNEEEETLNEEEKYYDFSNSFSYTYKKTYTTSSQSGFIHYLVIPRMRIGLEKFKLTHIATEGAINLSTIGDGHFNLNRWKYRYLGTSMLLNYGFDADLMEGDTYNNLVLEFTSLNDSSTYTLPIIDKRSYNGYFSEIIDLDTLLKLSHIYKVSIKINKNGAQTTIATRYLITTNIYNDLYNTLEDYQADDSLQSIKEANKIYLTVDGTLDLISFSSRIKQTNYLGETELDYIPLLQKEHTDSVYTSVKDNIFDCTYKANYNVNIDYEKYPFEIVSHSELYLNNELNEVNELFNITKHEEVTAEYKCNSTPSNIQVSSNYQSLKSFIEDKFDKDEEYGLYKLYIPIIGVGGRAGHRDSRFITMCYLQGLFINVGTRRILRPCNTTGDNTPVDDFTSKGDSVTHSYFYDILNKYTKKEHFTMVGSPELWGGHADENTPIKYELVTNPEDTDSDSRDVVYNYDKVTKLLQPIVGATSENRFYSINYLLRKGLLEDDDVPEKEEYNSEDRPLWGFLAYKSLSNDIYIFNKIITTNLTNIQSVLEDLIGEYDFYYPDYVKSNKELYKLLVTNSDSIKSYDTTLHLTANVKCFVDLIKLKDSTSNSNSQTSPVPSITIDNSGYLQFDIVSTGYTLQSEPKNIHVEGFDNIEIPDSLFGLLEENDNIILFDPSGNYLLDLVYKYENGELALPNLQESNFINGVSIEDGILEFKRNIITDGKPFYHMHARGLEDHANEGGLQLLFDDFLHIELPNTRKIDKFFES